MIKKSKKVTPKRFLEKIADDVRTITGSNLRNIMLDTGKVTIASIDVKKTDVHVPVPGDETWRINIVKELIDTLNSDLYIENLEMQNVGELLNTLCVT